MAGQLAEKTGLGLASPKAPLHPLVTCPTSHVLDHIYSSQPSQGREWHLLRWAVFRPGPGFILRASLHWERPMVLYKPYLNFALRGSRSHNLRVNGLGFLLTFCCVEHWALGMWVQLLMTGSPIAPLERNHTSEDKEQVVMVSTFPSHQQDTADQCAYLLFGCCNGHLTGLLNFPFSVLFYTRANFILPQSKDFSGGSPLLINSNKLLPQNFRPSIPLAHHSLYRPALLPNHIS